MYKNIVFFEKNPLHIYEAGDFYYFIVSRKSPTAVVF
jgi:hypothetical protein